MVSTLFLQSDVQDPYAFYADMLQQNPVYWDAINQLWAVYSYRECVSILTNTTAHIPPVNQNNKDGLNEYALIIMNDLARLSNGQHHSISREVAMLLFQKMKLVSIPALTEKMLQQHNNTGEIDFVNVVCRRLPVLLVLKSFDFTDTDANYISGKMDMLVKIMLAVKTPDQINTINSISKEIYTIVEKHLTDHGIHNSIIQVLHKKYKMPAGEIVVACVSNLIGLLIQAYDAGRGVLSNSFLQFFCNNHFVTTDARDKNLIEKCIIETLRIDPPVQNTRRLARENILLNDIEIKQGSSILIVLAAANRDPQQFVNPGKFDMERENNYEHLTFGYGHHECVAKYFSVYLATETLHYFFARYKKMELIDTTILYEPVVNVRLPKQLMISLQN